MDAHDTQTREDTRTYGRDRNPTYQPMPRDREAKLRNLPTEARAVAGGSLVESVCAIGAVVLPVLGLIGLLPVAFSAIASICLGVAMAVAGGILASRLTELVRANSDREEQALRAGMSFEVLAGLGGVALGILALVGVAPGTLLAISAIALGAGLLSASGSQARFNQLLAHLQSDPTARRLYEAANAASGADVLFGLSGVVLGILALIGLTPQVLILIAMLAMGVGTLFTGGTFAGRLMQAFGR
jgi:hypothetical protein